MFRCHSQPFASSYPMGCDVVGCIVFFLGPAVYRQSYCCILFRSDLSSKQNEKTCNSQTKYHAVHLVKQLKVPEGLILSTDYVVHFLLEETKDCDIFRLYLEVVKLVIDYLKQPGQSFRGATQ